MYIMAETYTLTLASANTNNRTGTTPLNYTYTVNWVNIIPEKYKNSHFQVTFSFKSLINSTGTPGDTMILFATGLNLTNNNTQGLGSVLGTVIPYFRSTTTNFWYASTVDNAPVVCYYPLSNQLNILLQSVTFATPAVAMTDYILQISFIPIK